MHIQQNQNNIKSGAKERYVFFDIQQLRQKSAAKEQKGQAAGAKPVSFSALLQDIVDTQPVKSGVKKEAEIKSPSEGMSVRYDILYGPKPKR
jgi:hypothetical protein